MKTCVPVIPQPENPLGNDKEANSYKTTIWEGRMVRLPLNTPDFPDWLHSGYSCKGCGVKRGAFKPESNIPDFLYATPSSKNEASWRKTCKPCATSKRKHREKKIALKGKTLEGLSKVAKKSSGAKVAVSSRKMFSKDFIKENEQCGSEEDEKWEKICKVFDDYFILRGQYIPSPPINSDNEFIVEEQGQENLGLQTLEECLFALERS